MRHRLDRPALPILCCLLLVASAASAGVTISFDVPTLNKLLPAMTPNKVVVPLAEGRTLTVELRDLRVTGLDPDAGAGGRGHILTSVRLVVPELGLNVPLEPELSLHLLEQGRTSMLELRFEEARIALPFGAIDIASALPPLRFPAEDVWQLDVEPAPVQVRGRLSGIEMGLKVLRFEFDLEIVSP